MVTLKRISKTEVLFIPQNSEELRTITKKLTFFIDGAVFSEKFKNGFWDGKIRFFRNKNEISLGMTKYVCEICEREQIEYKLVDFEKFNSNFDISKIKLTEGLRPHQIEAVKSFFNNKFGQFGIIKIPTRGGKTFTAAECIRISKKLGCKKSVFLVDGVDLFNQTVDEFSKFFNINKNEIGKLQGEGVWDFKEINVATIQTLSGILFPSKDKSKTLIIEGKKIKTTRKKTKEELEKDRIKKTKLEKLLRDVEFLIVDEVQEYSSDNRLGTIRKFKNLNFLLSLSATPFKSEDEIGNLNLREVVGDVIYTVSEEELVENGSLVKNKVLIILFDSKIVTADTYLEYYDKNVIRNDLRNEMVLKLTNILKQIGLKSLFMITRKEHGHLLSKKSGVYFVSGDDVSKDRDKIKTEFLNKKAGILYASDIYKKGVSLNSCEVLVNVSGGKEKSSIIQKRGRVLASSEGKSSALIIDIFDEKPYFSEHSKNRLEAYIDTVGEDNIIILESNDESFYNDLSFIIEEYFHGTR